MCRCCCCCCVNSPQCCCFNLSNLQMKRAQCKHTLSLCDITHSIQLAGLLAAQPYHLFTYTQQHNACIYVYKYCTYSNRHKQPNNTTKHNATTTTTTATYTLTQRIHINVMRGDDIIGVRKRGTNVRIIPQLKISIVIVMCLSKNLWFRDMIRMAVGCLFTYK